MAVVKYRDNSGNFVPVAPLTVVTEGSGGSGVDVVLPNMYHNCETNLPHTVMEYDVSNYNTLTFHYRVSQHSETYRTRSAVTISVNLGGYYREGSTSIERYNADNTVYVLNRFTNEVSSTYTLDVSNYNHIIITIQSTNPDTNAYVHEAGYVVLSDFTAE